MTDKPNDGGPAFAAVAVSVAGDISGSEGMSLRDYFAGQALVATAGITAKACYDAKMTVNDTKAAIVRQAFGIADAMLKARSEQS